MSRHSRVDEQTQPESAQLGRALSFMRTLWAIAHGLESTSKRMLATLGVTGPQRLVLRLVGHYETISAGDLARALHIHPSSLTGMLRRLERAGLLRRAQDPRDRRRVVLSLTSSGKRMNARKQGTVEALVEKVLSSTPKEDLRAAERTLKLLASSFEAEISAE
jgi:MarR family transcriptional regulator, organic hydroperoxide resistance regulator